MKTFSSGDRKRRQGEGTAPWAGGVVLGSPGSTKWESLDKNPTYVPFTLHKPMHVGSAVFPFVYIGLLCG